MTVEDTKYWYCCGSRDSMKHDKNCIRHYPQIRDVARWGTRDEHSAWDRSTIAPFVPTGQAVPIAGKVVGIVEYKGRIIVALEFGVYELVDGRLVRIKFEGGEEE